GAADGRGQARRAPLPLRLHVRGGSVPRPHRSPRAPARIAGLVRSRSVSTRLPFLVGIAGGSGSGKSALALGMLTALGPARACVLAHDAYYLDRAGVPPAERAALDFDTPEALDGALFREHLEALRAGRPVRP